MTWLLALALLALHGLAKGNPHFEPSVTMWNGATMPMLGFGTAGGIKSKHVAQAYKAGYRMFDTAQAPEWYDEGAVRKGLASAGANREDVWITSKLHARDHGYESVKRAFPSSLTRLNTTYIDAFLLHHPSCWPDMCDGAWESEGGTWEDSWKALEELYEAREVRAIGVSNFNLRQLKQLVEEVATVKPMLVQNHFDPAHPDEAVRRYCRRNDIVYVGYSTLGTQHMMKGGLKSNPILTHPAVKEISTRVDQTAAQVVLNWAISKSVVVIPRSSQKHRINTNLRATHFTLSMADKATIDKLSNWNMDRLAQKPSPLMREVKIINPTIFDVQVLWGDEKLVDTILPSHFGVQTTFVGHRFTLRRVSGEYIAEYKVKKQGMVQTFTIPNTVAREEL